MTQVDAFAHPFTYWVGMDTDPRTTPEALAEFNRFYSTTHVHEVMAAHAGFVSVSRYELVQAERGDGTLTGPRWLAVYGMADQASAEQYVRDNQRPWLHRKQYSPWPPARKKARIGWRMLWRQVSESGSRQAAGNLLRMVGTHEPEAGLTPSPGTRVTWHELYREFAHPAPGCPPFCAVYEHEPDATAPLDSAPSEAVWDLVYRRIPLTS